MQKYTDIRDILAYIWSIVCYPLFVTTYIMVIFCALFSHYMLPLPASYWLMVIGGTAFFTGVLPLTILSVMIKLGRVKNLDVTDRRERTVPYIYTLGCIACWCAFLHMVKMPQYIFWSAVASAVVLLIVMLITLRWKISVHLSSMGGAVAMVLGMMMQYGIFSARVIVLLFLISWLLMLARIRLHAHTPAQTVAGFLLGLIVVLIPNIFFAYVH